MLNVFLVSHFYHEPPAREIGQPLPVYLTVNKLYLYLYLTCASGNVKAVVMLLDVGSKVNGTDLVRDTPLHSTLRADHAYDIAVQLTTILLQYGASPTLLGRDDDMPLDIARQSGQTYCLELLEMAVGKKMR